MDGDSRRVRTFACTSLNRSFLSFPKVLNNFRVFGTTFDGNLPIDGLITNLFETAYVHPWIAKSHLRWLYVLLSAPLTQCLGLCDS